MSGQRESERERLCLAAVEKYLMQLGRKVAAGTKRDDDPPDYDLTIDDVEYAFEVTTLPDSDPDLGTFVTTRTNRMTALASRIEASARAAGILGGAYILTYPRHKFENAAAVEERIFDRAILAIQLDARDGYSGYREDLLWYENEEVEELIARRRPYARTRLGVPVPLAGDEPRVRLVRIESGGPGSVTTPIGPSRIRWGDRVDLARTEIVPAIQAIVAAKAELLRKKGDARPWILGLVNEHIITGSSDYVRVFRAEGDACGFREIFIVGRAASPVLGYFEL